LLKQKQKTHNTNKCTWT